MTLVLPLSNFGFQNNTLVCQLFELCVLFAMPRCCLLLELVVTRGRWPQCDNGVQVSLGNRRDLTQDAELPLGFFYAASSLCLPCIPSFLPFWCLWHFWKDMILCGWGERWVFSPCRERDEELRYCSHICPDDVRAVNITLHSISRTRAMGDFFDRWL